MLTSQKPSFVCLDSMTEGNNEASRRVSVAWQAARPPCQKDFSLLSLASSWSCCSKMKSGKLSVKTLWLSECVFFVESHYPDAFKDLSLSNEVFIHSFPLLFLISACFGKGCWTPCRDEELTCLFRKPLQQSHFNSLQFKSCPFSEPKFVRPTSA